MRTVHARLLVCCVAAGVLCAVPPAGAQSTGVSYTPPLRGAPSSVSRVGGGTRSLTAQRFDLAVLAPDHVGLTTRAQPTLYWFVSEPVDDPVELTVVDPQSLETLLELRLPAPVEPGVHALHLARHGVELAPDVIYQWFVAVVPDETQRSADVVAAGEIRRVAPPPELPAGADPAREAERYAAAGIWYEALDGVSRRIAARPGDAGPRDARAALLAQVGLERPAAWDRAH